MRFIGDPGWLVIRGMLAATSLASLAACSTPEPPHITRSGALPTESAAQFTFAEGVTAEPWLSIADVVRCLDGKGMKTGPNPAYLVQVAAAVRPANSDVRIGAAAEGPPSAEIPKGKIKGERVHYALLIDRLSDGTRAYEAKIDAAFKPKNSTPASRAALFCASLDSKLPL